MQNVIKDSLPQVEVAELIAQGNGGCGSYTVEEMYRFEVHVHGHSDLF